MVFAGIAMKFHYAKKKLKNICYKEIKLTFIWKKEKQKKGIFGIGVCVYVEMEIAIFRIRIRKNKNQTNHQTNQKSNK